MDRSSGLSTRTMSHLVGGRVTHEINADWDVGATAQVLLDRDTRGRQFGSRRRSRLPGCKRQYVGLGRLQPARLHASATWPAPTPPPRACTVRLRMKFDENTLQGLLSGDLLK